MYIFMENGRIMLLHSTIIGLFLYGFMIFILGQKQEVAENRSILFASFILILTACIIQYYTYLKVYKIYSLHGNEVNILEMIFVK